MRTPEFPLSPIEQRLGQNQLSELARLYAEVFAGPPWNEAVKCDSCEKYQGRSVLIGSPCSCGGSFVEAYPLLATIDYIKSEYQKPGFRYAILNGDQEEIVAFAWSYLTTPVKLAQSKWTEPQNQALIAKLISDTTGLPPNKRFRYISECGVKPEYRNLGLSNWVVQANLGFDESTIYRTNCLSPMMAVAARLEFAQVLGPQVIVDRKAKTIIETGQFINEIDPENPQRVLFFKPKL